MSAPHTPVLIDRCVELLTDTPAGAYVDATLGAAGHASAVLAARAARHGSAHLIGIDRDPLAHRLAGERLAAIGNASISYELHEARFDAMGDVLDAAGVEHVAAILLDLGLSSMHVDLAERGFSYRQDGPLDMRMGPDAPRTADDIVNGYDYGALARVLRVFGEEKFASRITRAIIAARPLTSTVELANVVRDAIPQAARRTGGHPATKTFQALRIEVNGELEAVERVLPIAINRLMPGGVIVVLAYHSLEDRLVKRAFTDAATGCVCPPGFPVCACGRVPILDILVRKPERPADAEVEVNRRASAARLRAAQRTDAPLRHDQQLEPR
jgi:16S rRNA (cytosine1402-N4)-methyltransferase